MYHLILKREREDNYIYIYVLKGNNQEDFDLSPSLYYTERQGIASLSLCVTIDRQEKKWY